jgi:cellulose biosynthesis protein BcsQ
MAYFLAVANRKGGVGKSTIAVMLAHAFAIWGGRRVLILDLDSQCNASLILLGGQGWSEARKSGRTIADYFYDLFDGNNPRPREYVINGVGDVKDAKGKAPRLALLPGSLLLEDVQGELFLKEASQGNDHEVIGARVRGKLERLLKRFAADFDLVILDCAPGLSFAALAALRAADRVLVPFRPDYVSQLAVDRVALLIEEKRSIDDLEELPLSERRYVCLANCLRGRGRERILVEEIGLAHPMLVTALPQRDAIANAFDWDPRPKRLEEKYGDGTQDVRSLYEELRGLLAA